MDAGVPVKCMIGGVAMGLIKEEDKTVVLTDIQGIEDFLGDMDFKVTGNDEAITALQMDMKVKGISIETLKQALAQAKEGRLHILGKMREVITKPREEMSPYAPRIHTMYIPVEDIGTVIGPGGKNIRSIIDQSGVEIDIQDDGKVTITSLDQNGADIAIKLIESATFRPVEGMVRKGKVVRIIPIGAFVELEPGIDGLVHISKISHDHIKHPSEVLSINEEVKCIILSIDKENKRIALSIKDAQ